MNPSDNKTTGYHLFLMPSGELKETLSGAIKELATKYEGVLFQPHITLLKIPEATAEQARLLTEGLAMQCSPLTLSLNGVGMEDAFFRAFYLKVEPNAGLEELHAKAVSMSGSAEENSYTPHLSLFYGNVSEEMKQEMLASLSFPMPMSFTAESLHLYKTGGTTEEWEELNEYPFSNP